MRWSFVAVLAGCTTYHAPDPSDPAVDAGPDAPIGSCANDFAPIANGQIDHQYKVLAQGMWRAQRTACADDGGYLAIPNSRAEAVAIHDAAGNLWIGVSDIDAEGSFVDSLGNPFDGVIEMNSATNDCIALDFDVNMVASDCTAIGIAICECEP